MKSKTPLTSRCSSNRIRLGLVWALWLTLVSVGSTAGAQTGVSPNAPEIDFYVGLTEACCGEDPHPVHGIATSDGGSIVVGKTITSGGWGGFAVKIGPSLPSTTGDIIDGETASLKWTVTIGQPRSKSVFLNAASTQYY